MLGKAYAACQYQMVLVIIWVLFGWGFHHRIKNSDEIWVMELLVYDSMHQSG